ncbi:MAG: hypothetical protein IPL06_00845 [Betaproteobacteria bacterium]|nr:hypothetical protein [Betaproteobacteria bacterium]
MKARTFLAAAILLGPGFAHAGEPTRWNCVYAPTDGEFIACQLLSTPVVGPDARPAQAGHERLPRLVKDIRDDPQSLDRKTVVIPLHNTPIDMARTGQLARAVMCGTRTDCEVAFHAERQGLVEATRTGHRPGTSRPAMGFLRR